MVLVGCQRPAAQPEAEAAPSTRAASEREAVTRPVSIAIPAAGVEARVVPVGLQPGGTMEVPEVDLAGWYELGPRPGEAGPAGIVGDVDSRSGPAGGALLKRAPPACPAADHLRRELRPGQRPLPRQHHRLRPVR